MVSLLRHLARFGTAVDWTAPAGRLVVTETLTVRVVGERGSPILLLHGLTASNRYWGGIYDTLAMDHRLVVPDLLGFGGSPQPDCAYAADDHVAALVASLDELGVDGSTLVVGHSLGALLALHLAALHPERVAAVIGFSPPLFADARSARRRIGARWLTRPFVLPGPMSGAVCRWMCDHRAAAARIASITHPRLPKPIAHDSVMHSWLSYSRTLDHVLLTADADVVRDVTVPVLLVAGRADWRLDHAHLRSLASANVTVQEWPGGHNLPLQQARRCCEVIAAAASRE